MSRRPGIWVILLVLVVIFAIIDASKHGDRGDFDNGSHGVHVPVTSLVAPESGFGGYAAKGTVRSISAEWRVPLISRASAKGSAATWIGVQGPDNAFIQVGTVENTQEGSSVGQYQVFWSDTVENFHPHIVMNVSAGDLIGASLNHLGTKWHIQVEDFTTHAVGPVLIGYSNKLTFEAGEWIQEDPVGDPTSGFDVPYPSLSNVTFQKLRLNGHSPHLDINDASVLSASATRSFIPSAIDHDGFVLRPAVGSKLQYLSDVYPLNLRLNYLSDEVSNGATPSPTAFNNLSEQFAAIDAKLRTQHWPGDVSGLIGRFRDLDVRAADGLKAWQHGSTDSQSQLKNDYFAEVKAVSQVAHVVRSRLGLPPA
jgi:Peptidase A4 family